MDRRGDWSGYLPDGRLIRVRRSGDHWQVGCEDEEASDLDLRAALCRGIGLSQQPDFPEPVRNVALRLWLKQHADRIASKCVLVDAATQASQE